MARRRKPSTGPGFSLVTSRHPFYLNGSTDWNNWRLTYEGGDEFRDHFLKQFSTREDSADFAVRRELTPSPSFAKAVINDIRNSIFERMRDISRTGGSAAYQRAVAGENLGVDRRGNSMNAFLGMKVLTELLCMGRCGIYVDNSAVVGQTLASQAPSPYLYAYRVEDILSWKEAGGDNPSEFQSVLLRDTHMQYDPRTQLPQSRDERYRLMWLEDGHVKLQFYDLQGNEIDRDGQPGGPIDLELTRIPFVMPSIGDSLLKDVWRYQVALLNLVSRDVWYALQSNFPFYIEQRDLRAVGSHLKQAANADGTATQGGQGAADESIKVGSTQGRAYGKDTDAPAFINPSPEPLLASIDFETKLEQDIRRLVNLAVESKASGGSAESKSLDNRGLEAGLAFIGLILQTAEAKIADFYAAYEDKNPSQRKVATVKYPDRYSLKTDADRIAECEKLTKLLYSVPGYKAKREIAKQIVSALFVGKLEVAQIEAIHAEIEKSDYLTSDPDTIQMAIENGICDEKTASMALGFAEHIVVQARKDHAARAKRILEAQTSVKAPVDNASARGVDDLDPEPSRGAHEERKAATDPTTNASRKRRTRGKSKSAPVSGASKKEAT